MKTQIHFLPEGGVWLPLEKKQHFNMGYTEARWKENTL